MYAMTRMDIEQHINVTELQVEIYKSHFGVAVALEGKSEVGGDSSAAYAALGAVDRYYFAAAAVLGAVLAALFKVVALKLLGLEDPVDDTQ
jgi:hypothetical protein